MNQFIALLLAGLICLSASACSTEPPVEGNNVRENPPVEQASPNTKPISQPVDIDTPEPETVWEVPGKAKVSLLQSEYPAGSEKMTVVFENTGAVELGYGLEFSCEKFVNGQWSKVEFADGIAFAEILCIVEPHSVRTEELNWSAALREPLTEGLYRVTGGKLSFGDEVSDRWHVDFLVTRDAQPEPDFALYVSQPVSSVSEIIAVHFVNNTGEDASVLSIPHLERKDENGDWQEVPWKEGIGFCGTPDPLPVSGRDWSEDLMYLWGRLEEDGQYRLYYEVNPYSESEVNVYGEFTVCAPEICGYPTAEQFLQSHPLED